VVFSTGQACHSDGLNNIPHPPGEGGVVYSKACVTRSYHQAIAAYKVPLYPQLLPEASTSNNVEAFVGQTDPTGYGNVGLPSFGGVAISVSGQSMFPLFNNVGVISHEMCELDKCNAHAGQGEVMRIISVQF